MNFPSKEFDSPSFQNNSLSVGALDQSSTNAHSLARMPYVDTGVKVDDASLQILMSQETTFADISEPSNQSIPANELESILEELQVVEKGEKEKEKTDDNEITDNLDFIESDPIDLPEGLDISFVPEEKGPIGQIDYDLSLLIKLSEFEKAYLHLQTLKKKGCENYPASLNFFFQELNKSHSQAKNHYYRKNFNSAIDSLPSFENLKWNELEPWLYFLILKNYKIKIESLIGLERFEEAQKSIEEKIKQFPNILYLQSYLCNVLYKNSLYEKTIEAAESILSHYSSGDNPDKQTRDCLSHAHMIIGKSKLRLNHNLEDLEEIQNPKLHEHFKAMLEYLPNDPSNRKNYIDFTIRITQEPAAFLERIAPVMQTNCIRTTYEIARKLMSLGRLEPLCAFLKKYKEAILNTEHLTILYKLLRLVLKKSETKDIFSLDISTVNLTSTPTEIVLGLTHCLENKRYFYLLDKALPSFKASASEKQNNTLANTLEIIECESLLLSGFDKILSNKFWTNQANFKKTGKSLNNLDSEIFSTFMLGISNFLLAEKCILSKESTSVLKNIVGAMKRYQLGLIKKEQLPQVNAALEKSILTPVEELAMAYFLRETGQQALYLSYLNKILINDPTNTHLTILAAKNTSLSNPLVRARAWLSGIHRVKNSSQLALEGLEDLLCLPIQDSMMTIVKFLFLALSLRSIEENLAATILKAKKAIEPYGFVIDLSSLPPIAMRKPFEEVPYDKSKYLGFLINTIRSHSSNYMTFTYVFHLLPSEYEIRLLGDVITKEHLQYFNTVREVMDKASRTSSSEADQYIAKNLYPEALKLIAHCPCDPSFGKTYETILEQKIFIYLKLKNYGEALKSCILGIARNPLSSFFNLKLAHIYLVKKEFKKSQYHYEFYLRNSDPKTHTHTTYYELALAINHQGKPAIEVAEVLLKAIQKNPSATLLSYAFLFNNILDKVKGAETEIIQKLPECFLTTFFLANYHYKNRNYSEAYRACAAAWAEAVPGTIDPDLLSTLAWTYLRSSLEVRAYSQTVHYWVEQNKKDPNSLKSILFELQFANIKEDPLLIMANIEKFMTVFSKTPFLTKEIKSNLNYLYAKASFFMGRLNDAEKHLLISKKNAVTPFKAIVFLMRKNFEAAKKELQKVPEDTFLHLLCRLFEDSQFKVLPEDCFERLEKALLEQRHLEYHIVYAQFLLEVNELTRLFNFLKTSVKITVPTSSSFLYLIFSEAYVKKSDLKSALFCLSQGLEHSPDKKLLFHKMASLLMENLPLLDDETFCLYCNKLSNFKEKGLPLENFSAWNVQQIITDLKLKQMEHTIASKTAIRPMSNPISSFLTQQPATSPQALISPQVTPSNLQHPSPGAETLRKPTVGSQAAPITIPEGKHPDSIDPFQQMGEKLSLLNQQVTANIRLLSAKLGIQSPQAQRNILPLQTSYTNVNRTPLVPTLPVKKALSEIAPSQPEVSNQVFNESTGQNPDIPKVLQPRKRVSPPSQIEQKPIIQASAPILQPRALLAKPSAIEQKPIIPTSAPILQPRASVAKPSAIKQKPVSPPILQPKTSVAKPSVIEQKPIIPASAPILQPRASVAKPSAIEQKPIIPTSVPILQSRASVAKPSAIEQKPIIPTSVPILQPRASVAKPSAIEQKPIIPASAPILQSQNSSLLLGEKKPLTSNKLLTQPSKKRTAEEKTLLSQEKERPSKKRASPSLEAVSKELLKGESDPKKDRARDLAEFELNAQEATIPNEEILEGGTFVQIQKIESPKIQETAKGPFTDLNNQALGNQITPSVSLFPGKRKSPPLPQDKVGSKIRKPPKKLKGLNESEIPTPPQAIDNLRSPTPPKMERQIDIKLEGQEIIEKLTPPQSIDLREAAISPNKFQERLKRLSEDTEKRMTLLSPNIQWTYSEVKDLSSEEIFNRWEPFDSQKKIIDFAYGSAFESWEPTDIRSTSGLLFDSSNELEQLKGEIFSKVAAVVALKEKRNSIRVSSASAKEIADLEKELHESQENEIKGDEKIDLLSLKEKLKNLKSSFEKEMASLEKEILEGEKECAFLREALLKKFTQFLLESTADFKSDIYYSARGPNYLLHKKALYLNSFNDFLICLKEQKKWALKSNQKETIFPLLKELQSQAKLCLLDFYKELPRYLSGHGIIKHGSREFYKLLYKVLKKSVIFGEKEAENNNFQILKELQKLLEIVETIKCFEDGNVTKMKLFIQEQFIKCYEE